MTVFLDRQDAELERRELAAREICDPPAVELTSYRTNARARRNRRRTIARVALVLALAIAALAVLPPLVGLP